MIALSVAVSVFAGFGALIGVLGFAGSLYRPERLAKLLGRSSLELVGRRTLRSNSSWMHNALRLVKGRDACTLLIHPEDAAARGLSAGDVAVVRSRVGEVRVPVELSDEVARGVVCLPHGYGHDREGTALVVAKAHAGASLNDLSDELRVDALSGNAAFSGTPVVVARS